MVFHEVKDGMAQIFRAFSNPARNWRQTVYVYRIGGCGQIRNPYLFKAKGFFDSDTELLHFLLDEFGSGAYRILIRDDSMMVYSGTVHVEKPRPESTLDA